MGFDSWRFWSQKIFEEKFNSKILDTKVQKTIWIMKKEIFEMFIKIGLINYFVENLEIGPDSETLIVVIPEKQWPWVSILEHPGFEGEDP